MTELSISRVARLTGVTSRTLRHYDSIGLLSPSRTAADGRRYYDAAALVRLQHILVLRELGLPLEQIRDAVDTGSPEETARLLTRHREAMLAERDRLTVLARTIARTIDSLEKGLPMSTDDMFDGFATTPYEAEARERWGDEAVDAASARVAALGREGQEGMMREATAIGHALAALAAAGEEPGSEKVQELIERHYAWVCLSWTPDAEGYAGLADMYLADPRFRAYYDDFGPGSADLLAEGMKEYAITRLLG